MPSNVFKGPHPKIDSASECVVQLSDSWDEYTAARIVYAESLLNHNWTHKGGKKEPHRASVEISVAYDDYFEKMDTFKQAHADYKTAIRELFRGHLL